MLKLPEDKTSNLLLKLFLLTDLVYILLHISYQAFDAPRHPHFSLSQDRGYSEIFQYVKLFWITCLLARLAYLRKSFLYFSWFALFAFILADDALLIHERSGHFLTAAVNLDFGFGFRAQDYAEFFILASIVLVLILLTAISYYFGSPNEKQNARCFYTALLVLIFFGGAMDMFHTLATTKYPAILIGTLEDGGEMIVISFVLWMTLRMSKET